MTALRPGSGRPCPGPYSLVMVPAAPSVASALAALEAALRRALGEPELADGARLRRDPGAVLVATAPAQCPVRYRMEVGEPAATAQQLRARGHPDVDVADVSAVVRVGPRVHDQHPGRQAALSSVKLSSVPWHKMAYQSLMRRLGRSTSDWRPATRQDSRHPGSRCERSKPNSWTPCRDQRWARLGDGPATVRTPPTSSHGAGSRRPRWPGSLRSRRAGGA
jgi:hypothetical protein